MSALRYVILSIRNVLLASLCVVIFIVIYVTTTTKDIETVNEIPKTPTEQWVPISPPSKTTLKNSVAICLNEYLGDDYETQMEEGKIEELSHRLVKMPNIQMCIDNQTKAAIIIKEGWIETVETMIDTGGKPALQLMILVCHKTNTDEDGIIDFVETLKCLDVKLKGARQKIDKALQAISRTAI